LRRIGAYQKGDERILGDSDFVKKVLVQAKENFERKYRLRSEGFNFEKVLERVAELLDLKPEQVLAVGKYKKTVAARSLLCFWATSELGISQSELGTIGYTPQLLVKSLTVTYKLMYVPEAISNL
jgi:chromosomal replication initiation ATPase DnaA